MLCLTEQGEVGTWPEVIGKDALQKGVGVNLALRQACLQQMGQACREIEHGQGQEVGRAGLCPRRRSGPGREVEDGAVVWVRLWHFRAS